MFVLELFYFSVIEKIMFKILCVATHNKNILIYSDKETVNE